MIGNVPEARLPDEVRMLRVVGFLLFCRSNLTALERGEWPATEELAKKYEFLGVEENIDWLQGMIVSG